MMRALLLTLALAAHPLHTTHTELREAPGGRVAVSIRAFTEDLHAAVQRRAGTFGDSAVANYVREGLELRDADGTRVRLQFDAARIEGDVTYLRFSASMAGGLRGASVRQAMLTEAFADQVNVVLVRRGSASTSLLFIPGDRPKALP